MASRVHVIEANVAPSTAPDFVGQKWVDISTGSRWESKGTTDVNDWVRQAEVPVGGTTGQVLSKNSNTDYDIGWVNQSGGATAFTSAILGEYKISTNTTPPPSVGYIEYNNATQVSATEITVHTETQDGIDIALLLSILPVGGAVVIQDKNEHTNYQIWEISATPVDNTTYWTFPVTLNSSGGTGTSNFPNNHEVFLAGFGGGSVSDEAYNEATWNGVTTVAPSKNAVRDKIESMAADIANVSDLVTFTQFGGLN